MSAQSMKHCYPRYGAAAERGPELPVLILRSLPEAKPRAAMQQTLRKFAWNNSPMTLVSYVRT